MSLKPLVQKGYPQDVIDPVVLDFFIAAYLALRIKEAAKPGRSAEDQLQFGIGFYHGARGRIASTQAALSPIDQGASVTDYPRVKNHLQCLSDPKDRDVAAYIEEVFRSR